MRVTTFMLFRRNGEDAFQIPIDGSHLTIGRGRECSICLPDPERHLSRIHLELRVTNSGVQLIDRSANGSWLDGTRLPPREMRPWTRGWLQIPGWRATLRTVLEETDEETDERSWRPPGDRMPVAPRRPFHGLIGRSAQMGELVAAIKRVAGHDVPVLIRGETGTGKELVARAVHAESRRARRAFVALNCAAIPTGTASSHLFGHKRGAFTGAHADALGAFREAHGGTLFLDELGELPRNLQATLLRALENREVVPVGTSRPVPVDVRLLAATHQDLERMVGEGSFRADLLFRLDVASVRIPPLRERTDDIAPLARHFLQNFAFGPHTTLDPATARALEMHNWPGNVRELRNATLRAVLRADGGRVRPRHLDFGRAVTGSEGPTATKTMQDEVPVDRERSELVRALTENDGNKKATASALGIARSTLYERMKRLGIE